FPLPKKNLCRLNARLFIDGISIAGFSAVLGGIRRRRTFFRRRSIRKVTTPPPMKTSESLCLLAASAELTGKMARNKKPANDPAEMVNNASQIDSDGHKSGQNCNDQV
ncbi:hypothetical protein LINPERHAP1_LOCUS1457, partial [Linum perenne]